MPSFGPSALLGVGLAVILGTVARRRTQAPSRSDEPVAWGRYWIRLGLRCGLGALLGTALLISGYWAWAGTPSSVSETGPELAVQTVATLLDPFLLGLGGLAVLLLWTPTRLYTRMSKAAIQVHVVGALTVGLGLTGVFTGFVGVPPIPRNAQAGLGLFLFSGIGLGLYLFLLAAVAIQHVGGDRASE
ncbi:MAG: hypothetical protein ABEK84_01470 [Salinibacter sp.]